MTTCKIRNERPPHPSAHDPEATPTVGTSGVRTGDHFLCVFPVFQASEMNACDFAPREKLSQLLTLKKEEKLHGGAPATSAFALGNLEVRGDGSEPGATSTRSGLRQAPLPGHTVNDSEKSSQQRWSMSPLTLGPILDTTYHTKINEF